MSPAAIHTAPFVPLAPVERDTLTKLFHHAVDRFADRPALRYREDGHWRTLTYRDVAQLVAQLAEWLGDAGVRAGDRVALLSENRPEWAIADYAILSAGAVTVPIYPTLPADQVAYIVRDSGARVAFVSSVEQLAKVQGARAGLPALERLVVFDDAAASGGVVAMRAALGRPGEHGVARRTDVRRAALAVRPDDLATIIYTSGTTGEPKGAMLTHYNMAAMIAATHQHGSVHLEPGEVALSLLPLSHVLERAAEYLFFDSGATIAYAESITKAASNMLVLRPHAMVVVPRVLDKIYQKAMATGGRRGKLVRWASRVGGEAVRARLAGRRLSLAARLRLAVARALVFRTVRARLGGRMRVMICGGAPLSAEVAAFFHAAGVKVYEGYGLTETAPVLTANRPGETRFGTVGTVYPGVELRLAEDGEIVVRGPTLMQGYFGKPEATREAIDDEGWFHTGDIGELSEDGFLRITDRKKDIIVTAGGKNIAPQPIENRVALSPYVAQAVLIGDRRAYPVMLAVPDFAALEGWAGEQGIATGDRAWLVEHPRVRELLERETLGRLEELARFERPKRLGILHEEFTIDSGLLTPTLKVRRRVVEQRFRNVIEALYTMVHNHSHHGPGGDGPAQGHAAE